ncbi:ABC transporter permease [Sorangium cellulosum]|uniref:ABC transporter permease n=1 Tax=Sorangium cellulosum TaxID=56 RepID=A0A2L0EZC8_SORCE|nr:ABC transporter permease subunit [Sorangium cellulosum]AUX44589.1 ABC transporter permease [Sorangium cellulosum]
MTAGTAAPRRAAGALGRSLAPWIAPIVLVVLWEALSWLGVVPKSLLPSPSEVVLAAIHATASGELPAHLGVSALRALGGLAIGAGIGLILGLATGLSRPVQLVVDGPLQMLRAIPALALVPLVILWFGLGEAAKLFIVAVTVLFPVYLNTFHGVRSVDPHIIEMARVYDVRGFALYREVILPGALPSILVGLRFAVGLAWLVLIVAETIGATQGLGYVAMNAREFMQMDLLVLTIVLWAILGKLADSLARWAERRLLPWQPRLQRMDAR